MVLRRYKRLEVSETDQGLADKNLLAGIATERMQPIVAFRTKQTLRLRLDPQGQPTGLEPGMTVWIEH